MISIDENLKQQIRHRLVSDLREYAEGRKSNVARGAETPELAALLVQKYGYGAATAVSIIFDCLNEPKLDIYKELDDIVAKIDPQWNEHQKQRWELRPAALRARSVS